MSLMIRCDVCGEEVPDILYWRFNHCGPVNGASRHKLRPVDVQALYLRALTQSDQEAADNERNE